MNKEEVIVKFVEMIKESWTYNRLTEKEKSNLIEVFYSERIKNAVKGTFRQRWEIL